MGFTLPLFVNATGRKYLPQLREGKQKEIEMACRFHTAPVGNEKNEGSMKLPPLSTSLDMLKIKQQMSSPQLHYQGHGRKFPPAI